MGRSIVYIIASVVLLLSCIKEDYPPECTPKELTEVQKSNFGGKWRWYSTTVEEWFDVGQSIYHYYTPQNQGFEYYFIITDEGRYKGYQNDTLVHDFILNKNTNYFSNNNFLYGVSFSTDCSVFGLSFSKNIPNQSLDTLSTISFPIYILDDENHLNSLRNSFVRE